MIISELIALLTEAKKEHGDVPVYVRGEPLSSIVEILHKDYYDELASGKELNQGDYLIIEHEHLEPEGCDDDSL